MTAPLTLNESLESQIPAPIKQAKWIWPGPECWDLCNCYALFRKEFTLEGVPAKAPLYITADQSYRLYINGEYVTGGPARGFQAHWPYDEIDAAPFLHPGTNLLAVRAFNPGTSNFQYISAGNAGLLAALDLGDRVIATDNTWLCRRQEGVRKDTIPVSVQIGFLQEHIDLRVEDPRWAEPAKPEGTWKEANARPVWNVMPWPTLEPRNIPQMEEKWWTPAAVIGERSGTSQPGYLETRDVVLARNAEGYFFSPAEGLADKLQLAPNSTDQFTSYLLDFGKTVFGCVSLSLDGTKGGEIVDLSYFETISGGLSPDYSPSSLSVTAFGSRMICRTGSNRHEFYHPYGFRYLTVTVRNARVPLTLGVALRWKGYHIERKGSFQSSNEVLTGIWEICAWTQQCCSLDAFVDTPWREQAQWWGDARVQAKNTFFLSGDDGLMKRGIHCIASQTIDNGLTYSHAPTCCHGGILPDFTLIWVMTLWDHYWQTGNIELFRRYKEVVWGVLGYFEHQTDPKTGLVKYDPRYWLFLDWTEISREGCPALLSLWLLYTLQKLEALCQLDADAAGAERMREWAARLEKALGALITPEGLLADGFTPAGERVNYCSVHSQTLAILTRLPGLDPEALLAKSLVPFIREETKPLVHPSSYWITYVFDVLTENGYGREVVAYIEKRWAPMVEHGTTWEDFAPKRGETSFSHAWSAHPLFHLAETVGGVRQTAPQWAQIRWEPVFVGENAEVRVPTPQGVIFAAWKKAGDKVTLCLELPTGVEAEIALPSSTVQKIRGKWSGEAALKV